VKYALDTNIVARLLDGDERVLAHLGDVDPRDCAQTLGTLDNGTRER
jgi:predicted nucleic acid-binding protein